VRTRSPRRIAVAAALALAGLFAAGYVVEARESADRRAAVERRGAQVMTFSLDRTTHTFETTSNGGVQTVVADDPSDSELVVRVRSHLREEAERFARGDFGDPAQVHGRGMPGLAELEAGADAIEIRYEPIASGGRISYATDEPALASALHAWFRAQVADHGRHAEGSF
jgi:hypothetical protein